MQKLKLPAILIFLSALLVPLTMYAIFGVPEGNDPAPGVERSAVFDMEISLYRTETDKVETVRCYEYICGVVAAEMSADFEPEALKAQAVAAFTYMLNKMNHEIPEEHNGAYMCDDYNHCKAYRPYDGAERQKSITDAVSQTLGKVITYDGAPINAVFHSTSCGMTASAYEVWGSDIAYLQSVECASDMSHESFETKVILAKSEFANVFYEQLGVRLPEDESGWLGGITLFPSGYVDKLTVDGTEYDGTYIRKLFSLRSASFDVGLSGDSIVFTVRGYGHGCGMSQNGANAMAKNGSSYEQILAHFYKDTQLSDYKI